MVLMLALGLSACKTEEKTSGKSAVPGEYPMTIVDSYNREVTFEEEPETVISLGPNITETIYAVGAGDKLIGRTDYCDYPEQVKDVQSVGSLTDPSVEKIAELNPDVVIASTHFKEDVLKKLEEAGVKVLVLYGEENFDGAYTTIEKVGLVLNKSDQAENVISEMKSKVSEVTEKVKGKEAPSVYYVIGYGAEGEFTATKDTFIAEMIGMAGGTNIADDAENWKYSLEKVIEKDPYMIICSKYFDSKAGIETANGYKDLAAVKEGRLYEIDDNKLDRQGPRLAEGLEELARTIHPDAFN